jgi:hypothetical protein
MSHDGMSKMVRDATGRFRKLADSVTEQCWELDIREKVAKVQHGIADVEHAMCNHDSFPFSAPVVADVEHFVKASCGVATTKCEVSADPSKGSAVDGPVDCSEINAQARHALLVNLMVDDMWTRGETSATKAHNEASIRVLLLVTETLEKIMKIVQPESALVDAVSGIVSVKPGSFMLSESERKNKMREILASLTSADKLSIIVGDRSATTQKKQPS